MVFVTTEIEIAAPPERVRELFLDWKNMPQWHKGHFVSIEITEQKGATLAPGDKLYIVLEEGLKFSPTVLKNDPSEFRWIGGQKGIFTGEHIFLFEPSTVTPGGTHLVQSEDFHGMLSFTMKPEKKSGATNQAGFEKYNVDIKAKAEEQKQE